ncbi:MAG: CDP-alcohol phosphatidyltransferase family protein [Myxococcales bacterium]|nr:CDP-alcohol phosphatidyltransferase family protein [Myxococcales bacterium]
MFARAKAVYLATRKKHDQLFNTYVMRPVAALVVVGLARTPATPNQITILNLAIFVGAAALFVALPSFAGGLVAVGVLELSYLFDCADGMLARHKKLASKQGHLFDFFTDEIKAVLLAGALGLRAWRAGGYGLDLAEWPAGAPGFLVGAVAAVAIIASATSLTNFLRHPEIAGRETPVEAHYETVAHARARTLPALAVAGVTTFLKFLNHYPSHIWLWAAVGRLDLFFWLYAAINLLYLGRGWLGLLVRFGRR